jgi:hypothetical protein
VERRSEHMAGTGQKFVVYVSDDAGVGLDPEAIFEFIAVDAASEEEQGWRVVSMTVMPMRQMGTAGNIVFQSGGQYATQAAVAVIYARS